MCSVALVLNCKFPSCDEKVSINHAYYRSCEFKSNVTEV